MILFNFKTWSSITHAAATAKTPSKDIIIAAGAEEIFFWPKICKANAAPPDNMPAYKISTVSNLILEKSISSKMITRIKENTETIIFCNNAMKNGKSKCSIIFGF